MEFWGANLGPHYRPLPLTNPPLFLIPGISSLHFSVYFAAGNTLSDDCLYLYGRLGRQLLDQFHGRCRRSEALRLATLLTVAGLIVGIFRYA